MSAERPALRVVPDIGTPGKWVVQIRQKPDGVTPMWFDVGDAHDTRQLAEAAQRRLEDEAS